MGIEIEIEARILEMTTEFRESAAPYWVRLRELLAERGIDPATAYLVYYWPEDVCLETCVIVTADRRAYEFDYEHLHRPFGQGTLGAWRQIGERWDTHSNGPDIAAALRLLSADATAVKQRG